MSGYINIAGGLRDLGRVWVQVGILRCDRDSLAIWGKYADVGRAMVPRGGIVGVVVRHIKCPLV